MKASQILLTTLHPLDKDRPSFLAKGFVVIFLGSLFILLPITPTSTTATAVRPPHAPRRRRPGHGPPPAGALRRPRVGPRVRGDSRRSSGRALRPHSCWPTGSRRGCGGVARAWRRPRVPSGTDRWRGPRRPLPSPVIFYWSPCSAPSHFSAPVNLSEKEILTHKWRPPLKD